MTVDDDLVRSHAHDMRAALNAMSLNLHLLRHSLEEDEGEDPEDARRDRLAWLDTAARQIGRLEDVLQDFVERARAGTGRSFDLVGLLREVVERVRPTASQRAVRLTARLPAESVPIHGKRLALRDALVELAGRAVEACPEDAELRLRFRRADAAAGRPEAHVELTFPTRDGREVDARSASVLVRVHGGALESGRSGDKARLDIRLPLPQPTSC